jgi:hypothetical protein
MCAASGSLRIDGEAVASFVLAAVKELVRALQQRGGMIFPGRERGAHGNRHRQFVVCVQVDARRADEHADPLGYRAEGDGIGVGKEEHKFRTPESRGDIACPKVARERVGNHCEDLVTNLMTVGVVDCLESVDVGEHDTECAIELTHLGEPTVERKLEVSAVRQPGEGI